MVLPPASSSPLLLDPPPTPIPTTPPLLHHRHKHLRLLVGCLLPCASKRPFVRGERRVYINRDIWRNRLSLCSISKNLKKSPTILIVISYNLKPVKISYANGRVSVRIFYKNNLINASSKSESRLIKLVRKQIHHSLPRALHALPTPSSPLLNAHRRHRHRHLAFLLLLLLLREETLFPVAFSTMTTPL